MYLKLKRWGPLLSRFLSGQALIQIINLCTAFLVLRLLSIDEYALFIVAGFYLNIGTVGSDLNLSTALSTFGARVAHDRYVLSGLLVMISGLRKKLFFVIALIIITVTPFLMKNHDWRFESIFFILLPVLISIWEQQKLTLRTVIMNIYHDSSGLFKVGVIAASTRLFLSVIFCLQWPFAMVAVSCNLLSLFVANIVSKKTCFLYVDESVTANLNYIEDVKLFIYPLIPVAIYFTIQGQITLLLISFFGSSSAIAEVGALTRFGQIFAFLGVLNGFLFQPVFSRISNKEEFLKKTIFITGILIIGFGFLMCSAWIFPEIWLLLLGKNYITLADEVALAFAGPIVSYFYGFFFTLLAARAFTQGQYWYVLSTMIFQILFIIFIGVDTTHKALELNLATATVTMLVEIFLFRLLIKNWR